MTAQGTQRGVQPEGGAPAPVLFLTYGMSVGGAEAMLVNLLNSFDRSLITPVLLSLAPPGDLEKRLDGSVRVLHAPRRSKFDPAPAREVARVVQAEGIRTVLTLGMFSYLFLRRSLKSAPLTRVFVSFHTTRPRTVKEFLQTFAYVRLIRRTDTVVTVCENQASYLSRLYVLPRSRFRTIYNGVDTERWCPPPPSFDRDAFRRHQGIPVDAPVILQVAQFRAEKRQDDSVRALAAVHRDTALRPVLVFVGGGDARLRAQAEETAVRLGVSSSVRFFGQQADPRPYYWGADLFTLSSVSETLPVSILEALGTGLPAVMTSVGGAREIITEEVNGAIARPADPEDLARAWRRVLENRGRFRSQTIREEAVRRFSLRECVAAYQHLLFEHRGTA